MTTHRPTGGAEARRRGLSRARVLEAAVDLADSEGLDAVSMRRLGQELGIEAMSLYTHVRNKEDLLDGMIDVVFRDIPAPPPGGPWKPGLRALILDARAALRRHPWAPAVIETRSRPGPQLLRHLDRVMGVLRGGGFSLDLTHHAVHLLGSRGLGFTRDLFTDAPGQTDDEVRVMAAMLAPTYPHIAEMALGATHEGGLGPCDTDVEFILGLDVILDGLERLRANGR